MKRAFSLVPVGLSIGALVLAACGSSDEAVTLENAWARTSAAGQTAGAIYFDLTTDQDDTLLAATVPASVAAEAQVHEVVMAEMGSDDMASETTAAMDDMGDMGDSADSDEAMDMGAMTMQELTDGLALKADETVSFEPGGYHIMLLGLAAPLAVGDEVELTLDFAKADDVTITVEVAESAP